MSQRLSFKCRAGLVSKAWKREWEKFYWQTREAQDSAKRVDRKECEGEPTKGLTYEELGRNNGSRARSWKNWRITGRKMARSVSNRNGGSHMMLDNKTEQK